MAPCRGSGRGDENSYRGAGPVHLPERPCQRGKREGPGTRRLSRVFHFRAFGSAAAHHRTKGSPTGALSEQGTGLCLDVRERSLFPKGNGEQRRSAAHTRAASPQPRDPQAPTTRAGVVRRRARRAEGARALSVVLEAAALPRQLQPDRGWWAGWGTGRQGGAGRESDGGRETSRAAGTEEEGAGRDRGG